MFIIQFKDDLILHDTIVNISQYALDEILSIDTIVVEKLGNDIIEAYHWIRTILPCFINCVIEYDGVISIYVKDSRSYLLRMCEASYALVNTIRGSIITYNVKGFLTMLYYILSHSKSEKYYTHKCN